MKLLKSRDLIPDFDITKKYCVRREEKIKLKNKILQVEKKPRDFFINKSEEKGKERRKKKTT